MSRTQTERQQIREDHPDSWIAVEPGDTIMGKIADVVENWSDQRRDPNTGRPGSWYPILVIEAEEANGYEDLPRELRVHCFNAVLYNEVMRKQPPIGEQIRITYQGTGKARSGQNPPELYAVRAAGVNPDAAARAYAKIGGAPAAQTPPASDLPVDESDFKQPELSDQQTDDIPF